MNETSAAIETDPESTESISLATPAGVLVEGELLPCLQAHDVVNPSDGTLLTTSPEATHEEVDRAITAARRAQPRWAADESLRRKVLNEVADALESNSEELARLVALETGKPFPAAQVEPVWAAEHARWLADADIPNKTLADDSTQHVVLEHVPLGVVAAIVPWNVPLVMAVHKFAAAARAGNAVVVKPSPYTPLATLRMAELVKDIVPAGVLNVLSGGDELGQQLVEHPGVNMIAFTGSVRTGRRIMAGAAPTLKRLGLELGGNDAAIVLDDADPAEISAALYDGAFILSGQVCQAIKRLYVHRSRYDDVVARLVEIAQEARPGDPFESSTTMGPLTTTAQLERVEELVADARARGGNIRTGGERIAGPGNFYRPTIVTDLPEDARLVQEEQFGPVLPVLVYDDLDEVIERANGTEFGLSASVWTPDLDKGAEVANRLVAGTVWVNRHTGVHPDIPFGGVRQSGLGREGGIEGLLGHTEVRTVTVKRQ